MNYELYIMNYKNIIVVAAVSLMLSGCGLYKKYEPQTEIPSDVTGVPNATSAQAPLSWREFFTDPLLQKLIEQVLAGNTDLGSARIAVEKGEASLKAAKLAYLPSFNIAPQGSISSFDYSRAAKVYTLPLQMDWEIEAFGSITNRKRAAKASLLQAQCYENAVHSNLVSIASQQYALLQVLDRQLEILTQTDALWNASLETQRSLWENGKSYSTAVQQMEASWLDVKTQIVDTKRYIKSIENDLCSLMGVSPRSIERSKWGSYTLSQQMVNGVSAQLLERRPDIRMANHVIEEAYYHMQTARAAFFPTITLSGLVGWTNNGGGAVVKPGSLLLNAIGPLAQPIFAQGKLKANLKITKLTLEDMKRSYVQTVIDAGNEVNEALADYQASVEKQQYYERQVEVLRQAYKGTHELMDNGKAIYLEVLTAQESLLSAQLSEAMNMYDRSEALIALYIALGGGGK